MLVTFSGSSCCSIYHSTLGVFHSYLTTVEFVKLYWIWWTFWREICLYLKNLQRLVMRELPEADSSIPPSQVCIMVHSFTCKFVQQKILNTVSTILHFAKYSDERIQLYCIQSTTVWRISTKCLPTLYRSRFGSIPACRICRFNQNYLQHAFKQYTVQIVNSLEFSHFSIFFCKRIYTKWTSWKAGIADRKLPFIKLCSSLRIFLQVLMHCTEFWYGYSKGYSLIHAISILANIPSSLHIL